MALEEVLVNVTANPEAVYVNCDTGTGFTTTVVCPVAVHPFAPVTVAVYTPAAVAVAPVIVGFERVEVNPLGPIQENDVPPFPVNNRLFPAQTGPLLKMAGVGGVVFWVMVMLEVAVQPPLALTVTVYVPAEVKLLAAVVVEVPLFHAYEVAPAGVAVTLMLDVEHVRTVDPVLFVMATVGVPAAAVMTMLAEAGETQVLALVTV